MTRFKLTIEYDGLPYAGWQRQKEVVSVQEVIEQSLAQFIPEKPILTVAGRTDAGVHATGQVAHFDVHEKVLDPAVIESATNHYLKNKKVAILKVEQVDDTFHARFSARRRSYIYRIVNRRAALTFEEGCAWQISKKLNVEKMRIGASYLIGSHDFTSFRDSQCQAKSPLRTLDSIEIKEKGSEITLYLSARSFLHHQVRIITGTLVDIGRGKIQPEDIKEILQKKDRCVAGLTAPAYGLYLVEVLYV